MVGIGTIISDNPSLTTRFEEKRGSDPIRIIVDSSARIPLESKVLNLNSTAKTIIAVTEKAHKNKLDMLKEKGAEIILIPSKNGRVDLKLLMKELGERKIDSILLEGGSELNYTALDEGIVDKIYSFVAPKIIGGKDAKTPVEGVGIELMQDAIKLRDLSITRFDDDFLIEGYVEGDLCLQE